MKTLTLLLCMTSVIAQDYGNEIMKINSYVVKTYSYTKELSNNIKPYEQALEVVGLSFKQIAPAGARVSLVPRKNHEKIAQDKALRYRTK